VRARGRVAVAIGKRWLRASGIPGRRRYFARDRSLRSPNHRFPTTARGEPAGREVARRIGRRGAMLLLSWRSASLRPRASSWTIASPRQRVAAAAASWAAFAAASAADFSHVDLRLALFTSSESWFAFHAVTQVVQLGAEDHNGLLHHDLATVASETERDAIHALALHPGADGDRSWTRRSGGRSLALENWTRSLAPSRDLMVDLDAVTDRKSERRLPREPSSTIFMKGEIMAHLTFQRRFDCEEGGSSALTEESGDRTQVSESCPS